MSTPASALGEGEPLVDSEYTLADLRNQIGQLRTALETRDVIGQAKGILMERHHVTAEEAFAMLNRASQHCNVKLRDLARELTESGDLRAP